MLWDKNLSWCIDHGLLWVVNIAMENFHCYLPHGFVAILLSHLRHWHLDWGCSRLVPKAPTLLRLHLVVVAPEDVPATFAPAKTKPNLSSIRHIINDVRAVATGLIVQDSQSMPLDNLPEGLFGQDKCHRKKRRISWRQPSITLGNCRHQNLEYQIHPNSWICMLLPLLL